MARVAKTAASRAGRTLLTTRAALYMQAQQLVHDEAPWLPLAHSLRFDPVRKEVIGYRMDVASHHYFDRVDLLDH